MDAAASEFKPGEAAGGRGKVSFESPSIVKISEFRPQPRPLEAVPDFSPASRRLASAASAPEFKSSFSSGAIDALSESFSRKVAFDSPSIARVSEFQPQGSSTSTYGRTLSSPNRYGASSDGTCTAEALPSEAPAHTTLPLTPFAASLHAYNVVPSSPSAHSPKYQYNHSPGGSFVPAEASDGRWSLVSTFADPVRDSDAASSLVVDAAHNILWAGHMSGQVTGYSIESSTRLVSFQAQDASIAKLMVGDDMLFALGPQRLNIYSNGGARRATVSDASWSELRSCDLVHPSLMAISGDGFGAGGSVCTWDLLKGCVATTFKDTPASTVALVADGHRALCCGGSNGCLVGLDLRSRRITHSSPAFSGPVTSLCMFEGLVVSTGLVARRSGDLVPDVSVKVWDCRNTAVPLFSLPACAPPSFVQFVPACGTSFASVFPDGSFQICDTATRHMSTPIHGGSNAVICSVAASFSHPILFVGDCYGSICAWAENPYAAEGLPLLDWDTPEDASVALLQDIDPPPYSLSGRLTKAIVPVGGDASDEVMGWRGLPTCGLCDDGLASTWPSKLSSVRAYGAFPVKLDKELLAKARQQGGFSFMLGHLSNSGGLPLGTSHFGVESLSDIKPHPAAGNEKESSLKEEDALFMDVSLWKGVPEMFKPLVIKPGRFGVDDFDFKSHNSTPHATLENSASNSWCNSWLQSAFFLEPLRSRVSCHLCTREVCLACELSFVMHMLSEASAKPSKQPGPQHASDRAASPSIGSNVHATNFFRALRLLPEASALALIDANDVGGSVSSANLNVRMQKFYNFVLEQLNKEMLHPQTDSYIAGLGGPSIAPSSLFGSALLETNECYACRQHSSRESQCYQFRLLYPPPSTATKAAQPKSSSFLDLLESSLLSSVNIRAWCSTCQPPDYKSHRKIKSCVALSPVLAVTSGIDSLDHAELGRWQTEGWIPDEFAAYTLPGNSSTSKCLALRRSCEPPPQGSTSHVVYKLAQVLSCIFSSPSADGSVSSHIILHTLDSSGRWVLVNGFAHSWSSLHDVVDFHSPSCRCRAPCVAIYTRTDIAACAANPAPAAPITASVFANDVSLSSSRHLHRRTFEPATMDELVAGRYQKIVGIDAEFVSLSEEETVLRSDGSSAVRSCCHLHLTPHFAPSSQVVRPSRLSLGRVSVVRGYEFNSRPAGCVMIDDYIKTPEQVVDYSTRYSGLVSGDLDPAVSKHHLIPLKRAYLKIRFMVDSGWTFVGHHLQNDFRILNIYVPPERIIDTVQVCEQLLLFWDFQLRRCRSFTACPSTAACCPSASSPTMCSATSCKSTPTIPMRTRAPLCICIESATAAAALQRARACRSFIVAVLSPAAFVDSTAAAGTSSWRRPGLTR
jgi:PAB-dependent poly(A)-specific ribonuclease subunit 2